MKMRVGGKQFVIEKRNVDFFEEHAAERRATWTGFLARSFAEAEAHERAVNEVIPPEARVEMIWELVLRMPWGSDATEYRLDRTVGRVERRGR